jgi:type II secretory pathway pseudopilin PulG
MKKRICAAVSGGTRGYAMAALLVGLSIMAIMASVALPVWQTLVKREREAELIFRGEQYAQAIALFQRRFAGTFPPSIDLLLKQKFLRRAYKDPITGGDFQLVYVGAPLPGTAPATGARGAAGGPQGGQPTTPLLGRGTAAQPAQFGRGGIMGVVSRSTAASLRLYNGRGRYNEWVFVATQASTQAGAPGTPGTQTPGRGGRRGLGPAPFGGRQMFPGQPGGLQGPPGQLPPIQMPGRSSP